MSRKLTVFFRILFFVYVATVLALCFFPFNDVSQFPRYIWGIPIDKVVHFCMFFPFPILAYLAMDQYTSTVRQTVLLVGVTFIIGLVIAVGTEWGQASLTDWRSGDPLDFLADSIALLLGSILAACWDIRKQKK